MFESVRTEFGPFELFASPFRDPNTTIVPARDRRSNQHVSIQILTADERTETFVEDLREEVDASSTLEHPAVWKILDVVDDPKGCGIVMPSLEGEPLAAKKDLTFDEVMTYATDIAELLAVIQNRRDGQHLDLNPRNLWVTKDGIKIRPVDVARVLAKTNRAAWRQMVAYAAPEEMQSRPADGRADVFSFGCLLYETLTDQPLSGYQAMPNISGVRPELPAAFDRILEGCVRRDPGDRWKADHIVDALWNVRRAASLTDARINRARRWRVGSQYQFATSTPADGKAAERPSHEPVSVIPPAARRVNAWLESGDQPLRINAECTVGVNIGARRTDTLLDEAFNEPKWDGQKEIELFVSLSGAGARVTPGSSPLTLPRRGDSAAVFFSVTPLREGLLELYLGIYLARELTLLEEFRLSFEVVAEQVAASV